MAGVLGRNPATGKAYASDLPIDVSGGVVGYDSFDRTGILSDATTVATDVVTSHVETFANLMPGTVVPIYCRGGVQPERLSITARTDIYLAYVMPTVPAIGGVYGIEGDGHIPALAPDAMCDAQGLT